MVIILLFLFEEMEEARERDDHARIEEIEKEMAALGVAGSAGVRVPRAKNDMSLVDALADMRLCFQKKIVS